MWVPAVGVAWQIMLLNPITSLKFSNGKDASSNSNPDVPVFDIDLFDNSAATIAGLHKANKRAICYFSAGTYEPNRPDSHFFQPSDLGSELPDWPGERWLNLKSANVRSIMAARIGLASSKGCDAIDPDNVDAYNNDNGIDMSMQDSIDFVRFLSAEATKYKMSTGLKNAGEILLPLLPHVHFSVNEQCSQMNECDTFQPFIAAKMPVFNIEYNEDVKRGISSQDMASMCKPLAGMKFSTVLKPMDLGAAVRYC